MTTTPETLTRLIGPIPEGYTGPSDAPYAHPGGPCPEWGGYRPLLIQIPIQLLRADITALLCDGAQPYTSHTGDTVLIRTAAHEWYVLAPPRPTRRGVVMAVAALRARASLAALWRRLGTVPDELVEQRAEQAVPLPGGLLPEEQAEAQRIYAAGGAVHRHTLPWEPPAEHVWSEAATAEPGEVLERPRSADEE